MANQIARQRSREQTLERRAHPEGVLAQTRSRTLLRASLLCWVMITCGCIQRPAWPERDGARWLDAEGFDAAIITRVVEGYRVSGEVFDRLEDSTDLDVLFLYARNPHLPRDRMERLSTHPEEFVRAGLARNPALPPALVQALLDDPAHSVWIGLAVNPSLGATTLLELKERRQLEWSWFAGNPGCPPLIQEKIRESNDRQALTLLNRVQDNPRGWPVDKPWTDGLSE